MLARWPPGRHPQAARQYGIRPVPDIIELAWLSCHARQAQFGTQHPCPLDNRKPHQLPAFFVAVTGIR
jgi:hypothetical protein